MVCYPRIPDFIQGSFGSSNVGLQGKVELYGKFLFYMENML